MAIINSETVCRVSRDGAYCGWNPDMETAIEYHDPFQHESLLGIWNVQSVLEYHYGYHHDVYVMDCVIERVDFVF